MRYILSLLLIILLASCATTTTNYYPKTVNSWQGANVNQLMKKWGHPNQKVTTLSGNTVYIYKSKGYQNPITPTSPIGMHVNRQGGAVFTLTPSTYGGGAKPLDCLAAFEFNAQGTIVDTKVQGNGCYADKLFADEKGFS